MRFILHFNSVQSFGKCRTRPRSVGLDELPHALPITKLE
jgi:hypothetical protein